MPGAQKRLLELEKFTVNTETRFLAYEDFNVALSGKTVMTPPGDGCMDMASTRVAPAHAAPTDLCAPPGYTLGYFNGVWNTHFQATVGMINLMTLRRFSFRDELFNTSCFTIIRLTSWLMSQKRFGSVQRTMMPISAHAGSSSGKTCLDLHPCPMSCKRYILV
jgi:hypothetical protein